MIKLNTLLISKYHIVHVGYNMIMAMPLKPNSKLGVIDVYRMKIYCAVSKLSYFFTLLMIEMFP